MTPEELHAELRRRTSNPHVIERIMRLNPKGMEDGCGLRGWRVGDHMRRHRSMMMMVMPRGRVIREFGRAAWDSIPRERLVRDGRRQWARWQALRGMKRLAQ